MKQTHPFCLCISSEMEITLFKKGLTVKDKICACNNEDGLGVLGENFLF